MAKTSIPLALRSEVITRARGRCEYCQMPNNQELNAYPHEVDHVTAKKHGGHTRPENLAYACFDCNRHKGTDLSSIDPHTGQITPLFTPREHQWEHHFRLQTDGTIIARTATGRATVQLLHFNDPVRVHTRAALIAARALESQSDQD
jgi:HNH endonuclease